MCRRKTESREACAAAGRAWGSAAGRQRAAAVAATVVAGARGARGAGGRKQRAVPAEGLPAGWAGAARVFVGGEEVGSI